jgi:hypothetical protein
MPLGWSTALRGLTHSTVTHICASFKLSNIFIYHPQKGIYVPLNPIERWRLVGDPGLDSVWSRYTRGPNAGGVYKTVY